MMMMIDNAVTEPLPESGPQTDDHKLKLFDWNESSAAVHHPLKDTPNSVIDWNYVRAVQRLKERDLLSSQVAYTRMRCDGMQSCCSVQV